jgi:amidase
MAKLGAAENVALQTEFKAALNGYLAGTPHAVKSRSLSDLIAFDRATPAETPLFGQEIFEQSQARTDLSDPKYVEARAAARRLAGPEGLDKMMREAGVDVIVMSGGPPAASVDPVIGDNFGGPPATLPAVTGYPHLTVPMGFVSGLPVGLSFMGPKWSDGRLLALGYAFEQATHARRNPTFPATVSSRPEIAHAYDVH